MKREIKTIFRKANVEYFVDDDNIKDSKEMSVLLSLSSNISKYSDNVLKCFTNIIGSYLSLELFYHNPKDIEAYDTNVLYDIKVRIVYNAFEETVISMDKCKATPYFGSNRIVFTTDILFNNSDSFKKIEDNLQVITNIQKTLYRVKEVVIEIDDGKE